jgi:hypothetical protein
LIGKHVELECENYLLEDATKLGIAEFIWSVRKCDVKVSYCLQDDY